MRNEAMNGRTKAGIYLASATLALTILIPI